MSVLVTGAAGFIGSRLVDRLLGQGQEVIGVDNFVLGRKENLESAFENGNFRLLEVDLADYEMSSKVIGGAVEKGSADLVWHMAANSEISAGAADPQVDLRNTFMTTFNTLAIMRELNVPRVAFASSSAVYGELSEMMTEKSGPLFPISNYGAMKLASEALISSAVEAFLGQAWIFRFPNVVGKHATHGVISDFISKLHANMSELEILGDGRQRKSYLHVDELLDAMCFIMDKSDEKLSCYNIGTHDEGATVELIADIIIRLMAPGAVKRYTGGRKGWVGDVPEFRFSTAKLEGLGWRPQLTSGEAIKKAVTEILAG